MQQLTTLILLWRDTLRREELDWTPFPKQGSSTANPAAGANPAVVTVPAGKVHLLLKVFIALTTDATATSRAITLAITDGTNTKAWYRILPPQTASLTNYHTFGPGLVANTTLQTQNVAPIDVPGIELPAGWTWQVIISNIQGGDDCDAVQYEYKERAA